MITSTAQALLTNVYQTIENERKRIDKISIIGAGTIGSTIAFSLIAQNVSDEVVLIDQNEALVRGEVLDLQQAAMFAEHVKVYGGKGYYFSSNSRICIITIGAGYDEHQDAIIRNTTIFKDVIPKVVKNSPNAILIIVTNPVDILTYVAWKLSKFPPNRVIGYGNVLQSARFRHLLADELKVSPNTLHAFVIGQQGPKSVPVWSGVSVSGVRLRDINNKLGTEDDPENWVDLHKQAIKRELEVERLKSCESWGLALSVTKLSKAILQDTKECFSVSTHLKGCRHGDENSKKDVFLSLPCIIGTNGVFTIVKQILSEKEKCMLQDSANYMNELQKKLNV
ncbi:hypothetical protein FQR65_LT00844 [Abscondita terminalis]|nr:hypothetical protein FQR65_LT00844 [Abscondita terminalis]